MFFNDIAFVNRLWCCNFVSLFLNLFLDAIIIFIIRIELRL